MNRALFFESIAAGLDGLIGRTEHVRSLPADAFNQKTAAHEWTLGQQFGHLLKSDTPTFKQFYAALGGTPRAIEDEIRHTFFGRMIINAMVKPNIPVPKVFLPEARAYDAKIVQEYLDLLVTTRSKLNEIQKHDLSKLIIRSPAGRFFKYNGYDLLAISVSHGERHLGQSEAILRQSEAILRQLEPSPVKS